MLAVAGRYRIQSELIPAIATGFCGGMARTSTRLCGAYTGGIMAIGLRLGRKEPEASHDDCYAACQRFYAAFMDRFKSETCPRLLGCDLATKEGQHEFETRDLISSICIPITETATTLVMEAIEAIEMRQATGLKST